MILAKELDLNLVQSTQYLLTSEQPISKLTIKYKT